MCPAHVPERKGFTPLYTLPGTPSPAQLPAGPLRSIELSSASSPSPWPLTEPPKIAEPLPQDLGSSCNLPRFCFCSVGDRRRAQGLSGCLNPHHSHPQLHHPHSSPRPSVLGATVDLGHQCADRVVGRETGKWGER